MTTIVIARTRQQFIAWLIELPLTQRQDWRPRLVYNSNGLRGLGRNTHIVVLGFPDWWDFADSYQLEIILRRGATYTNLVEGMNLCP